MSIMVATLALFVCLIQLLFVDATIRNLECNPDGRNLHMQWETESGEKQSFDFNKRKQTIRIAKSNAGNIQVIDYKYIANTVTVGHFIQGGSSHYIHTYGCDEIKTEIHNALTDDSVTAIKIGSYMVKGTVIPKRKRKTKRKTKPKPESSAKPKTAPFSLREMKDGGAECHFIDIEGVQQHVIFKCDDRQSITIGRNELKCVIHESGASASKAGITKTTHWHNAKSISASLYTTSEMEKDIINDYGKHVTIKIGEYMLQHRSRVRLKEMKGGGAECWFQDVDGNMQDVIFEARPKKRQSITIGEESWPMAVWQSGISATGRMMTRWGTVGKYITTEGMEKHIKDNLGKPVAIKIGDYILQHGTSMVRPHKVVTRASKSKEKSVPPARKVRAALPADHYGLVDASRTIASRHCRLFSGSNDNELNHPCQTECEKTGILKGKFGVSQCQKFGRSFSGKTSPCDGKMKRAVCNKANAKSMGVTREAGNKPCVHLGGDETNECFTDCIALSPYKEANECNNYDRKFGADSGFHPLAHYRDKACMTFENIYTKETHGVAGYIWACPKVNDCSTENTECNQKKSKRTGSAETRKICRMDVTGETKDTVKCNKFYYMDAEGRKYKREPYGNAKRAGLCAQRVWVTGGKGWVTDNYILTCVAPAKKSKRKETIPFSSVKRFHNYSDDWIVMMIIFILFIIFGICCFCMGGGVTLIGFGFASHTICDKRNESKYNDWDCQ